MICSWSISLSADTSIRDCTFTELYSCFFPAIGESYSYFIICIVKLFGFLYIIGSLHSHFPPFFVLFIHPFLYIYFCSFHFPPNTYLSITFFSLYVFFPFTFSSMYLSNHLHYLQVHFVYYVYLFSLSSALCIYFVHPPISLFTIYIISFLFHGKTQAPNSCCYPFNYLSQIRQLVHAPVNLVTYILCIVLQDVSQDVYNETVVPIMVNCVK